MYSVADFKARIAQFTTTQHLFSAPDLDFNNYVLGKTRKLEVASKRLVNAVYHLQSPNSTGQFVSDQERWQAYVSARWVLKKIAKKVRREYPVQLDLFNACNTTGTARAFGAKWRDNLNVALADAFELVALCAERFPA